MKRYLSVLLLCFSISFISSCAVADYIQNKCRVSSAINLESVSRICLECESPVPLKFASKLSSLVE